MENKEQLRCAVCKKFVSNWDRLIVIGKSEENVRVHYKCMDRMPTWMRVLQYMRKHGSITQAEVLKNFPHPYKTWRLSEYIRELRHDKGFDIETEMIPRKNNSPLAKYILKEAK